MIQTIIAYGVLVWALVYLYFKFVHPFFQKRKTGSGCSKCALSPENRPKLQADIKLKRKDSDPIKIKVNPRFLTPQSESTESGSH